MHMHTPSTPLQQYHTRVAAATRTQSRTAPARHSPITLKKMRIGTAAPSSPIAMASYRSHIASATLTDHTARALAKSFCASNMGLGHHARCDAEIQDGRHFADHYGSIPLGHRRQRRPSRCSLAWLFRCMLGRRPGNPSSSCSTGRQVYSKFGEAHRRSLCGPSPQIHSSGHLGTRSWAPAKIYNGGRPMSVAPLETLV